MFMPDFRASGIAGNRLMTEAFRRPWLPAADPEASLPAISGSRP
jgi:hypothetical protein